MSVMKKTFRYGGWKYVDEGGIQLYRVREQGGKEFNFRQPLSIMDFKKAQIAWSAYYDTLPITNSEGEIVARLVYPKSSPS